MGRLSAKAPVVAVALAGIVAIGIIDNDYLLIPIAGIALGAYAICLLLDYLKLKATVSGEKSVPEDEMRNRLSEIERRMTDVQDVMIALSEKIDRLDMGEKRDKM